MSRGTKIAVKQGAAQDWSNKNMEFFFLLTEFGFQIITLRKTIIRQWNLYHVHFFTWNVMKSRKILENQNNETSDAVRTGYRSRKIERWVQIACNENILLFLLLSHLSQSKACLLKVSLQYNFTFSKLLKETEVLLEKIALYF